MNIIQTIQANLRQQSDPVYAKSISRWFKEPIKSYGVKTPIVRKIAREHYHDVKHLSKNELFDLCEQLMGSGYFEEFIIASSWTFRRRKEFKASDFSRFKSWTQKYVSNWASCDDFCTKSLGYLLLDHPELVPKIKTWTKSKNQWMRRACAVSMIIPIRKKQNLDDVFDIALDLLEDQEDLVQKGYGWMLKEATRHFETEIFNFVMKYKSKMPRTAPRYAIEKMPKARKQKAMN